MTIIQLWKKKRHFIEKYGQDFVNLTLKNDYIWAYPFFENPGGNKFGLNQIKKEINKEHGKEQFKLASNIIHSSSKSIISNLGNPYDFNTFGASDYGLKHAGNWGAYELLHINITLLSSKILLEENSSDNISEVIKHLFTMKVLYVILQNIYKTFDEPEDILFSEEDNRNW